jgi:hypothetical protein
MILGRAAAMSAEHTGNLIFPGFVAIDVHTLRHPVGVLQKCIPRLEDEPISLTLIKG